MSDTFDSSDSRGIQRRTLLKGTTGMAGILAPVMAAEENGSYVLRDRQ